MKKNTQLFTDAFYDSTLPPEVKEAVAANLSILKSTTVLRQYDGRMWNWEEVMIIGALVMVHARMFGIMRKLYLIFSQN